MAKLTLKRAFLLASIFTIPATGLVACGGDDDDTTPTADAGEDTSVTTPDTGARDTGADTTVPDTGVADTGTGDTGTLPVDAGPVDSGPVDSGRPDTGPVDSGPQCAVPYGCAALACSATPATNYATTAVSGPGPIIAADGAYVFTGGKILTGQAAGLPQGAAPRTLSLWMKTTAAAASQSLFTYGSFAAGKEFGLLSSGNNAYFVGYNADVSSAKNIADNAWHHVAATYNGTRIVLYVDGVQVAAQNVTLNTTGGDFAIGQSIMQAGREPFLGSLSDVRIYDRVLPAAEIAVAASLAAGGNPEALRSSTTGLVYWLPLIGAAASENDRCVVASPKRDCKEILTANAASQNGLYTIDVDGAGAIAPFEAYCDMTGGGWTQIFDHDTAVAPAYPAPAAWRAGLTTTASNAGKWSVLQHLGAMSDANGVYKFQLRWDANEAKYIGWTQSSNPLVGRGTVSAVTMAPLAQTGYSGAFSGLGNDGDDRAALDGEPGGAYAWSVGNQNAFASNGTVGSPAFANSTGVGAYNASRIRLYFMR